MSLESVDTVTLSTPGGDPVVMTGAEFERGLAVSPSASITR